MNFKWSLILFICGALYALGFPSILASSLLMTPIIALSTLIYFLWIAKSLKIRLIATLIFFSAFNLTGFYWITQTLQEFGGLNFFLALSIHLLFSLIVMPYMWAGTYFVHRLRSKGFLLDTSAKVLSLSFVFTLLEAFVPQQFDSHLGSPWIVFSDQLYFASIGGVSLYSFFSFILIFEIIRFITQRSFSKFHLGLVTVFIVLNPLLSSKDSKLLGHLNVRLVQANISNYLKASSESGHLATSYEVISRYQDLSLRTSELSEKLDLIIWPETAYPYSIRPDSNNLQETSLPFVVEQVAIHNQAQMVVGGYALRHSEDFFMSDYNTAFLISPKGRLEETYNKRILIPFGETLPFGDFNQFLAKYLSKISFFAAGEKFPVFSIKEKFRAIVTICYEILKADYVRDYLMSVDNQVDFMINLTNDSWYGETAEPYQHLFLSKWRSIEFDIPIIRSTNTGISSVIFANGKESRRTGVYSQENLDLKMPIKSRADTLYYRYGIMNVFAFFIVFLIFDLLFVKLRR